MPRPADFVDAHRRHWDDAELLLGNERWANADQLYGFSAECGLKAVMQAMGMPVDAAGTPSERYRKHVRELWPEFRSFAAGPGGARYSSRLPKDNPFTDWSHHDRYAASTAFRKTNVEPHREAARKVRDMVRLAMQDGRS